MTGARIERMTPEGWERVRRVRLRALADAPDAFGKTLAQDSAEPPAWWRARLADPAAATFVAVVGGEDAGLVIGAPYDDDPRDAGLFAMWVAPGHRGLGVGDLLVDAVVGWARERGAVRVVLDVADRNLPAVRLYERKGFRPTGVTGSLPPPREHVPEHQRACIL